MTARTANDVLKARVGDLMFEVANLTSQVETLRDKLVAAGRMLPPEKLAELKLEIVDTPEGNGEDAPSPEG